MARVDMGLPTATIAGLDRGGFRGETTTEQHPAAIYARKWQTAERTGAGLFVARSGASATPLLERLIDRLPTPNGRGLTVIEAAAGSGDQAIHLARNLRRTNVVAVDTSPHATAEIARKRAAHEEEFGQGSEITIVTGDVLDVLSRQEPGSLDGYHGNSFWHFLTEAERIAQLKVLSEVGTPGGLVAVSFKAKGDGLLSEPGTEVVGKVPQGILAVPGDGIKRLFVSKPDAVAEEFAAAGFTHTEAVPFEIPDYDVPGKPGQFYGFLSRIPA